MSRSVTVTNANRKLRVDSGRIAAVARAVRRRVKAIGGVDFEIVVLGDADMKRFNRKYTGRGRPTDVLSFMLDVPGGKRRSVGVVMVSSDTALRRAASYGNTFERELALYAIHGMLHLAGYDDHAERDRRRMRDAQERLCEELCGR